MKTALQLSVRNSAGRLVARGTPDGVLGPLQSVTFQLDRQLPADTHPYTITARFSAAPEVSASSRLSVYDVPRGAGTHVGDAYVAVDIVARYAPGTIFHLAENVALPSGRRRVFVSDQEPEREVTETGDDDAQGLAPVISDPALTALRRRFIDLPIRTHDYTFNCVNALGQDAVAQLLPGNPLRIDVIARAAHALIWLPDDPRRPTYSYPCDGDCSRHRGVFVDSPLVVRLKFEPGAVRLVPQPSLRIRLFHGDCVSGYAVLQDSKQLTNIFTPAPVSP